VRVKERLRYERIRCFGVSRDDKSTSKEPLKLEFRAWAKHSNNSGAQGNIRFLVNVAAQIEGLPLDDLLSSEGRP
jgi:hypothetical protein